MPTNRRLSGIFKGKNWLCWDVGPALFSKITLFSLSEDRSVVFCGPQISQIYGPAARCWKSSSFEGDDKKRLSTLLRKKCTLAASVPPPNVKSWLCAWQQEGEWTLEKVSYDWRDEFDPERNASFWPCECFAADCSSSRVQLLLFLLYTHHKQPTLKLTLFIQSCSIQITQYRPDTFEHKYR